MPSTRQPCHADLEHLTSDKRDIDMGTHRRRLLGLLGLLGSRGGEGGFTLLEVLIALLIATVGFLGTVAVQQTMFNATANASDAAIATRLAIRALEEQDAKRVSPGPPIVDQLAGAVTPGWSAGRYRNALGMVGARRDGEYRFREEIQIVNLGPGLPYNVSVRITYALDSGATRAVRLDRQRLKTW